MNFSIAPSVHAAPNIDATNKYAWSENAGWVNFNPSSGAVEVTDTAINGHIWIANYGWVNLQPPGAGVTNTIAGNVGGHAWGENTGYIDFSGVTIEANGEFSGYATNAVLGSISMNCSNTSSCGSSDFKVQTTWLPTIDGGGGGGIGTILQNQQNQEQNQQETILEAPVVVSAEPIDTESILLSWEYNGVNHTGFEIVNGESSLIVNDPEARSHTLQGLFDNTLFDNYQIRAFNSEQASELSGFFPPVVTDIEQTSLLASRQSNDLLRITLSEEPTAFGQAETALQFELTLVDTRDDNSEIVTTDWLSETQFTQKGVTPFHEVQVRSRLRNQVGRETTWSEIVVIPANPEQETTLSTFLAVSTINGLPTESLIVSERTLITVSLRVANTGFVAAETLFASITYPERLTYIPSSLRVNNAQQTDQADADFGQQGSGTVSVVIDTLAANADLLISFQLEVNPEQVFSSVSSAAISEMMVVSASVNAANAPVLATSSFQFEVKQPEDVQEIQLLPPTPVVPDRTPPESAPEPLTPPPLETPVLVDPPASEDLFLTADIRSQDELLEFAGTITSPDSDIVVLIRGMQFSARSDANGFWTILVDAESIGVQPGESAVIPVEVYGLKEDQLSNRVIQEVAVTRALMGEVVVEVDDPLVRADIAETIVDLEEELVVGLSVAAPVIVVASAPLWGYLPYLPTLLYHFIIWLLSLFRKKKEGRLFGIVYNAVSKEPMPLAIVRVFKKNENGEEKLVSTQVTDKQGRYEFLLEPGQYRMEAKKPEYFFPSKIVTTAVDGEYQHVYAQNQGLNVGEQTLALPDIPLDPVNAKRRFQLANVFKKLWLGLQNVGHFLALPLLFLGSLASIITVVTVPENPINWILAILYVFMFILQLTFREKLTKAWGVVYEVTTNAVVPLATLQLIDPEFGKVVKSRLSDYEGRFSFLPEPGKYVIKASKEGYTQAEVVESRKEHNPIQGEVTIQKEGEHIDGDVAMKQA